MVLALILPIATLVAAIKAASVRFHVADHELQVWRPVLSWCMVAVALTMNVFCYTVVARALH
jgi:Mn2+/Fe2+ NRAMP family transporter